MLKHYIKIAFRNLWKYKAQSLISIIGLAVGFTCFALCSYMLRMTLALNENIKDVDRICLVYSKKEDKNTRCGYRYAAESLKKEFPEIESGTTFYRISPDIEKLCEAENNGITNYFREVFLFTDHNFPDVFNIRLLSGNKEEIFKEANAILLTEKSALKFFGTTDVVGKTFVNIDDFHDKAETIKVSGVIENFPERSLFENYAGIELNHSIIDHPDDWRAKDAFSNYVKIKPNTDLKQLNNKLNDHVLANIQNDEIKVQLIPLRDENSLYEKNSSMSMSLLFFIAGVLVLLITLINYVSFVFGHILNRIKECGIRKVNGAVSHNLFFYFITETTISFLFACLFSVVFIFLLEKASLLTISYYTIDRSYMLGLLGEYMFIGFILLGFICFFSTGKLIKMPVVQSLHGGFIKQKKSVVRNIFLIIQLIICFLFIGASWFVFSQKEYLENQYTLGLSEDDKSRIFDVSLNGDKILPARQQILSELQNNPNIEMISRNGMDLLQSWQIGKGRFFWDNITSGQEESLMAHMYTDANYLDFIKMPVKEGRFFIENETDKAVVNESFVDIYGANPIGKQISVDCWGIMKNYTIVGILPDFINCNYSPDRVILPSIYMPYPDDYINLSCYVKVKKGYEEIFRKEMTENLYKYVHKATPVYVSNLEDTSDYIAGTEYMVFRLIAVFSVICIIICMLGIYASVVIITKKRRKEVAIRKINGAKISDIIWLFCKYNLLLIVIAFIIAVPVLFIGLSFWLQNYLIHINISFFPFFLIFVLMIMLVSITVLGQVIHISRINPAEVLKSE